MTAMWHFVRHRLGEQIQNPLGGEHFSAQDDDWQPGEVLVRESIQNALDAGRRDEDMVSVRFWVSEEEAMSDATAEFWFSSLWPHLRSRDCRLPDIPEKPRCGGFIVVEDFGTCGLTGDIRQGGLGNDDNRFFNFFRAEGLSGNPMNGNTGGSWGIGKSVFNRCSSINSFLALTGRRTEGDLALIGKSLLWHHRLNGEEYRAIGQYGIRDATEQCLILPATSYELCRRFTKDFRLARCIEGNRAEPGLSVVIPYPFENENKNRSITAERIIDVVMREYFYPILAGRLSVQVGGLIGGKPATVNINKDNLFDQTSYLRRNREAVTEVLKLARWSLEDGPSQAYRLNETSHGKPPEWSEDLLRPEDSRFKELCQRFNRGEPVSIYVPVWVHPRDRQREQGSFNVYLKRDQKDSGYRPIFVRGSIVVPNARQRAIKNQSLFSLVTIDDGPLAVMLRAAEPPAHTDWQPDTANIRGRYNKYIEDTINFVVSAPKFLADIFSGARTERDLDIWADLFPMLEPDGIRKDPGENAGKGQQQRDGPIEPPPPRLKPFRIDQMAGGFRIVRDNADRTPLPRAIEARVAYDTSRRDPFKWYHRADFTLERLQRRVRNAREEPPDDNRIIIHPDSDDFELVITGFDEHRDLVVEVRTIDAVPGDK